MAHALKSSKEFRLFNSFPSSYQNLPFSPWNIEIKSWRYISHELGHVFGMCHENQKVKFLPKYNIEEIKKQLKIKHRSKSDSWHERVIRVNFMPIDDDLKLMKTQQ